MTTVLAPTGAGAHGGPTPPARHAARARAAALAPGALAVAVLTVAAVAETVLSPRVPGAELVPTSSVVSAAAACLFGVAATVILLRLPRHPFGRAMGWIGALASSSALAETYVRLGLGSDDAWPAMTWALWWLLRPTALLPVALVVLVGVFPSGRLPGGRWGVAVRAAVGVMLLAVLAFVVGPTATVVGALDLPPGVDLDPTTVDGLTPLLSALGPVPRLALFAGALVVFAATTVRYRASTGLERDRMRWLAWSLVVLVVVTVGWGLTGVGASLVGVAFGLPVAAMAVGVVSPRLLAVERLLAVSLVYGGLALVLLAVDLLVVAALTAVLGGTGTLPVVLAVTVVTVLLYGPLRGALARAVRRRVLGHRDDPYDVLTRLAADLEAARDAPAQLAAVADSVARAFGVGWVRVEVELDADAGEPGRLVASRGRAPAETRTWPLAYRGTTVGRLVLPARGVRTRLGARDERLLGDLVRQAARAVRSTELAATLAAHRTALVVAREEELRRIRRDLHDGLGPALGGAVFVLEAARLVVDADPAAADERLAAVAERLRETADDVRRLVEDLRPPRLDELGLGGAVAALAEEAPVETTVTADDLPALPAAVEVAAYRIVGEALANTGRHAAASRCEVALEVGDGSLRVRVADDGRGVAPTTRAGIGLASLRERAAELGGRTEVTCPPDGGTVVTARLPLRRETEEVR